LYSWGSSQHGALGLGQEELEAKEPVWIQNMKDYQIVNIST
jgi:alpha-tubulin suppressor-like RCC1 family protein